MNDRFIFRQVFKPSIAKMLGESFYYWGYVDDGFVSPLGKNEACQDSEQSTGLRDKNGRLIFEGDIRKLKSKKYGVHYAVVTWDSRKNGFLLKGNKTIINDYVVTNGDFAGNKYENPELLECVE